MVQHWHETQENKSKKWDQINSLFCSLSILAWKFDWQNITEYKCAHTRTHSVPLSTLPPPPCYLCATGCISIFGPVNNNGCGPLGGGWAYYCVKTPGSTLTGLWQHTHICTRVHTHNPLFLSSGLSTDEHQWDSVFYYYYFYYLLQTVIEATTHKQSFFQCVCAARKGY